MPDQENVDVNSVTDEQVDAKREEVEALREKLNNINANTLEVAKSRENEITYNKLENEERALQAQIDQLLAAGGVESTVVVDDTAPAGVPSAVNPAAPTAPVNVQNTDPNAQQEAQDAANADGENK